MLVGCQLVFVHIPRTGGRFIREALQGHLALDTDAPRFPGHASYEELPVRFRDRSGFCVVRNPWDWYVSWYHFVMQRGPELARLASHNPKRTTWETAFRGGRSSFAEVVTRACEGRFEHPFAESARRRDVDLYSEHVRVQASGAIENGNLEPGRFEELVPFLLDLLDRHDLLTEPLRDAIERTPPINASQHGPYSDYYDEELRELVGHKARWLTERFGYAF
jgi:hypothetical protein